MRHRLALVFIVCVSYGLALSTCAGAQSLDLAAGVGRVASGNFRAGTWLSGSATGMISNRRAINFGADFDVAHAVSGDNPLSWTLLDANLVIRPRLMPWTPELQLGWGGEHHSGEGCLDFPISGCIPGPGQTINAVHMGFAVNRTLPRGFFLRFEYHLFAGTLVNHPSRFTISLGHSFGF